MIFDFRLARLTNLVLTGKTMETSKAFHAKNGKPRLSRNCNFMIRSYQKEILSYFYWWLLFSFFLREGGGMGEDIKLGYSRRVHSRTNTFVVIHKRSFTGINLSRFLTIRKKKLCFQKIKKNWNQIFLSLSDWFIGNKLSTHSGKFKTKLILFCQFYNCFQPWDFFENFLISWDTTFSLFLLWDCTHPHAIYRGKEILWNLK